MKKILVTGACGQLGTELMTALQTTFGTENVVATDIKPHNSVNFEGTYELLDVMNPDELEFLLKKHNITEVYHLAAMLSAVGEQKPLTAWDLNMKSLLHVLEAARKGLVSRIFWPSSIAVFGTDTPKVNTPQEAVTHPATVYGISKLAGELWCQYYFDKHAVDVRSVRYPGLIGYKGHPGGGTTDYAVEIFHKASRGELFNCFLRQNSKLPMMYMDDAIRATIELMSADKSSVHVRTSYNLAGMSFSPEMLAAGLKKHIPELQIAYHPDSRQAIADSWPDSIDDTQARNDWGWKHSFDLEKMIKHMLDGLKELTYH